MADTIDNNILDRYSAYIVIDGRNGVLVDRNNWREIDINRNIFYDIDRRHKVKDE